MRKRINLNQDWTFYKEGKAEKVSLPHTWNALDGQDGGGDYYRGCCRYVKYMSCPPLEEGEEAYLEFLGASASAEVKVNGHCVGSHDGGYSAFRFRITDCLMDENIIEVFVDNSANDRVYPQKADFTFYGGIYRDVNLILVPKAHFALGYCGGSGMRVTPGKNGSQADIELEFWLENAESLPEGSMIEAEILDDGVTVAKTAIPVMTGSSSGTVLPGGCQTETPLIAHFSTHLTIDYPHLWQGRRDPHLYTAAARLTGTDSGRGGDEVSLRFGCRTFYVDPEKGFFLNGEPYPLRGVSRHQDREGVGNALIKEMHREDIELIAETGANSIRLAHYQHDPYFYDLCDEYGMVVWAEIPYITVQLDNGRENILSQMRELIIQNHHHAAICFWGISNEITAGGFSEAVLENNKALDKLAKELDPARLTAMAFAFMMEDDCPLSDVTDVIAYNHYFGWYTGELEDNDQWFDGFHRKYPKKCAGLSEYGAEAVLSWQTGCPQRGDYTEQYQAVYHEHMLKMIEDRPFLWCTYVWNMFDFAADGRDEGGVKGRNNKGLVTFDRKIKKDAFYLYKAYWSEEPFLHLAGKRYKNRAEKETEIIVYTNQNHVELFQNGKAVGSLDGKHVFRFQVLLEEKNEIRALAGEGLEDRMMICRVEKPDPSYSMPVLESVSNWLDDIGEAKDGFFSLEDRVKDLVQDPEGMALFREFMEVYDGRRKGAAAAVHMTEEQRLKTMSSMRLKELMRRTNTPPEEVRMWAERLQRIPRK